jgi:hypothetical protein
LRIAFNHLSSPHDQKLTRHSGITHEKPYIALQPSEGIIVQAAATIYAGYLTAGRVPEGSESDWIAQSIKDAIRIAQTTDENVQSDNEVM